MCRTSRIVVGVVTGANRNLSPVAMVIFQIVFDGFQGGKMANGYADMMMAFLVHRGKRIVDFEGFPLYFGI